MIWRQNYTLAPLDVWKELLLGPSTDGLVLVDQCDWAARPAANTGNSLLGWVVYRLSDALQASKPVFFKVMFEGNNVYQLKITLEVGSGYAAGVVTGSMIVLVTTPANGAAGSYGVHMTIPRWYMGLGTPSSFAMQHTPLSANASQSVFTLLMERARSADGALHPSGDLIVISPVQASQNQPEYRYLFHGGATSPLTSHQINSTGYMNGFINGARSHEPAIFTQSSALVSPMREATFIGTSDTPSGRIKLNHYGVDELYFYSSVFAYTSRPGQAIAFNLARVQGAV